MEKKLIKFYKKFEEQSQKFKKNCRKFLRKFLERWLTDCENDEMWWNINRNLSKFYKKRKKFSENIKIWAILKPNFMRSLLNL